MNWSHEGDVDQSVQKVEEVRLECALGRVPAPCGEQSEPGLLLLWGFGSTRNCDDYLPLFIYAQSLRCNRFVDRAILAKNDNIDTAVSGATVFGGVTGDRSDICIPTDR
jgi:hypothetical protein